MSEHVSKSQNHKVNESSSRHKNYRGPFLLLKNDSLNLTLNDISDE